MGVFTVGIDKYILWSWNTVEPRCYTVAYGKIAQNFISAHYFQTTNYEFD